MFKTGRRDKFNTPGKPATLEAYNAPPRVTAVTQTATFDSASIAYTHSDDPDFAGAIIWLSANGADLATVAPDSQFEVYRGPDTAILLPGLMFNADYYFRIAAYDAFGPTELLPSGILHFKTTHLDVDAIADGVLGGSKLIPELQDRIDLIDADEFIAGSVNARIKDLREDVFVGTDGLPAAFARIQQIDDVSATSGSANARELHALKAQVNNPDTGLPAAVAQINEMNNVSATSDSALARSVHQAHARLDDVGGTGATIEQKFTAQANTNTGLMGQYTVKIDLNGAVAGFGLASETNLAGETTSEFIINADKFGVIMPSYPGVKPFTVGAVNGVPRVILSNALIGDASISSAMIGDAQINSLKLAGEAVTIPEATYAPGKHRSGTGTNNYVVVNEGYIRFDEPGMLYMLATASQGFHHNSRQWRFKLRLNGVDTQQVQGGLANDAPVVSATLPVPAGVNHVEAMWAAENSDVIFGYCNLLLMGVKR